jgi:FlaA1/EpsC-like NDP-sugar epimerase
MASWILRVSDHKAFRRACLVACDVGLCVAAYLIAFYVRFVPEPLSPKDEGDMWRFLPLLLAMRLPSLFLFDLYRLSWRYVGAADVLRVVKATSLSTLIFTAAALGMESGFPRGVLILDWFFVTTFLVGERLFLRVGSTLRRKSRVRSKRRRRVLILGVSDLAESLARDFGRKSDEGFDLVGFLDERDTLRGQTIHGRPVFGGLQDVARVVVDRCVDELIIALPDATGAEIRRIIRVCEKLPVRLRILHDPLEGHRQVALAQVRDISLEDLLRRPPVRIDLKEAAGYLSGQVVLVTGAGGSIGSELVRQLVGLNPRQILLLGHGEHSVFQIHQELTQEFNCDAVPLIADVGDRRRLDQIFAAYAPTVVFHAAAHKHVPLMESNLTEAVKNNVLGTRNLLWVSERHQVKTFLLISTDKAVNPSSVMGVSKRVAELMVQCYGQSTSGRAMVVRFGNVLGSRGSVVPIIQRQIVRSLPVTITHPDMERYFMTIPEAVSLIIQAGAMGARGEVFVLEMGEPVRIVELARDLVRLCGLVPDRDVRFRFTGIRPGEKLTEEVLTAQEGVASTRHDRIRKAPSAPINEHWLHLRVNALAEAAAEGDEKQIVQLFGELVPGYTPCAGPAHDEEAGRTDGPPRREAHLIEDALIGAAVPSART